MRSTGRNELAQLYDKPQGNTYMWHASHKLSFSCDTFTFLEKAHQTFEIYSDPHIELSLQLGTVRPDIRPPKVWPRKY